jgi:hypothetical protein
MQEFVSVALPLQTAGSEDWDITITGVTGKATKYKGGTVEVVAR